MYAYSIVPPLYWGIYFERKALKALATSRPEQPIHAVPEIYPPPQKVQRQGKRHNIRREQAWLTGDTERRADGRLFWDGRVKFCAEYHLDEGCQQQCPHNLSHRCEFCLGWHRTVRCGQKPEGWTPPPRHGKGKGQGKGKAKRDKGGRKGGGRPSHRSW